MLRVVCLVVALMGLGMLAACGSGEPTAEEQEEQEEQDDVAALPTVTEVAVPDTATPEEPTATLSDETPVLPTTTLESSAMMTEPMTTTMPPGPPTVPPEPEPPEGVSPQEEPPTVPTPEPEQPPEVSTVQPESPAAQSETPTPEPSLEEEPHAVLGSPDAPITMYEFSDFGCPSCRQFALFTFPTLKEEYIDTGKVRFVYKDYPIVSEHGHLAAQAAECAGEQGAYWEMHDQLFLDPAAWNTSPEEALATFRSYAETLEIDADALSMCIVEERFRPDVDADFQEGLDIGIFGTPTFIINRKLLGGAQPIEVFREVIDRELATETGE
jgi:protein-disulfide isomerase